MSLIEVHTRIAAPPETCFDLARSVEVHLASTAHTRERAVAGRTTGLCEKGDTITWRARHFGIFQHLTVRITELNYPRHFQDKMVKGAFQGFTHDYYFEADGAGTHMRDRFEYAAPLGPLGRLAEWLFLDRYMRGLLEQRNAVIRELAERNPQVKRNG